MSTPSHGGDFGAWLRRLRHLRDLTQEALADEVGCAVYTLRAIEAGRRRPSREIAGHLAAVLAVPAEERDRFVQLARSGRARGDDAPPLGGPPSSPPAILPELLHTKLYAPPPPPHAVPRARLLANLAAHPARLALMVAPPGFGKSTFLAQLFDRPLSDAPRPLAIWLSLDEGDDDPTRFLLYLLAAVRRAVPTLGERALSLLGTAPPTAVTTSLINELSSCPEPLTVVFDDYHVIASQSIHDLVALLVERGPPRLRLLVASRSDPPWPLARWRARGLLAELRAKDLRFDAGEAAQLLVQGMGLPLTPAQLATLDTRTEGWAAGLHLAGLALQGQTDVAGFLAAFGGSHRFVLDYLAGETLTRLPEHLRAFVLRTSVLRRMCAALCDAVLDVDDDTAGQGEYSSLLLGELERWNLFLVPLDGQGEWWRYHHLFAEMLRVRLRAGASPREVAALHRRAARWYAAAGEDEEAIHHAQAAGDDEQTFVLLERVAPRLLAEDAVATLLRYVKVVPEERLTARPVLLAYTVAALVETGATDEAERLVEAAVQPEAQDDPVPPAHLLGARAKVALLRGAFAESAHYARQALDLLGQRELALRCELLYTLTGACTSSDDLAGALKAAEEGLALRRRIGSNPLPAVFQVSNLLIYQGRLAAAEAQIVRALTLCSDATGALLPTAATLVATQGFIHLLRGELAAAEQVAAQAHAIAAANGLVYSQLYALHLTVAAHIVGRRAAAASVLLADMRVLVEQSGSATWRGIIEAREAEIAFLQGDLEAATRWAERTFARLAAVEPPVSHFSAVAHVCLVVLAANGRQAEALALARRMGAHQQAAGDQIAVVGFALHEAVALAAGGQREEALATLVRVARRAEAMGLLGPFLAPRPGLVALLRQARPGAPAFVDRVLKRLEDMQSAVSSGQSAEQAAASHAVFHSSLPAPQPSAEALSGRELEVLRLLCAGRSNQAIAEELIIAVGTVKRHLHSIFGKLGVTSRAEAIACAHSRGLLDAG